MRQQNIGRLHIAVQQVALVRIIQRVGDGGDDLGDLPCRQAGPVLLGE
jgi:hypothetical protein